jgi:CubicO group peptidase (beta-lactamase class C family)
MKPDLAAVEDFFWESFRSRGELGASLSVWHRGREVLSLAGGTADPRSGRPWGVDTPVLVWSASKGPAAACLLHLLQQWGIALSEPVCLYWPEFAQAGKGQVTFAHVLSHQSGLPALDAGVSALEHEACAAALAAQSPFWIPGTAHGYHPRTLGPLLEELVRRVGGRPLAEYWRTVFAEPLGLEFWFGVPPERLGEIAPIFPPRVAAGLPAGATESAFYTAFFDKTTLTARAFQSPRGMDSVLAMNRPDLQTASLPAFGGIGTARALGKFYALLAEGGLLEGKRLFEPPLPWAGPGALLASGDDRVLLRQTAFTAGFMRDPVDGEGRKMRRLFGPSLTAFGQPGAGGSHAFADPENGIAFAYVMNQMERGVLPNVKSVGLIDALYRLPAFEEA